MNKQAQQYALGIDLGGTSIKYGISSLEGNIVKEFKRSTQADKPADIILEDLINAAFAGIQDAKNIGISISAIGIGTPGSVNVETGFLSGSTPNLKNWRNVPIKERLEARLKLPVFADNDANIMAFGETRFGAGIGYSDVVCITLGTGIGGGIIISNQIFRGSFYAGAELGHMSIAYDGTKCRCGGIGCWEKYASATAMIERYNELDSKANITDTVQIFENYDRNEPVAKQVVEEEVEMVAAGLANLVNVFNPQIIIIGGGLSEVGEWFINRISEATGNRAMECAMKNVQIVKAKLGNKAGWLGAAAFALEQAPKESCL